MSGLPSFERPEALLLLLAVPLLVALQVRTFVARRWALRTFGGHGAGLVSTSGGRQIAKGFAVTVGATVLVLALAAPAVGTRERVVTMQGVDLAIALDVSQSMAVRDAPPDRLRTARRAVESLGKQLSGSRAALVLFAGDGAVRYPPTSDPAVLAEVLDNSPRAFRLTPGSSLRAGLQAALEAFPSGPREAQRRRAILVVSDGEDTAGDFPDTGALRSRGIRVFAFGVGTPEGGEIPTYDTLGRPAGTLRRADGTPVISRLDEDALRQLAERGDGRYWRYAGDEAPVRELVAELRTMDVTEVSKELVPDDRFQVFIALGLALLLLEWLVSERRAMPRPRSVARAEPRRAAGAVRTS